MGPHDSNAVPLSPQPPLRQLWEHADRHRPKVVLATIFSVLNKICDIAPELLIGAAVDVVVGEGQSFIGEVFGIEDPVDQLYVLAIITVIIWVLESITDYIAEVLWRNLAQDIEHDDADGRVPPRPGARAGLLRGPHLGRAHGGAQRRRQPARAVPRRRRQPDDPHDLQRGVRRPGVLRHLPRARVPRLPADPGDRDRVAAVPEEARAPVRRRAGRGRADRRHAHQQPRRHRHHQGVHRRGARGRARRDRQPGLRRGQRRGDPALERLHPADPHGDPRRLHRHARGRRHGPRSTATSTSGSTPPSST